MRAKRTGKQVTAFLLIAALCLHVFFTAMAADISTAGELGQNDPYHYNGIVFNYFESYGGDMEGALAVGGTSKIGTSGQYDVGGSALHHVMGPYKNPNGYPSLLLGGAPTIGRQNGSSYINVYGGNVVMAESLATHYSQQRDKFKFRGHGVKYADDNLVHTFFSEIYSKAVHAAGAYNEGNTKSGSRIYLKDFTGWGTNYRTTFSNLSNFEPNNLDTSSLGRVLLINVMDTSTTIREPGITADFDKYDLIIFNFPNATDPVFTGGSLMINGSQINTSADITHHPTENARLENYAGKVVWCFPKATSIKITSHGVVGSILAPDALVEASGGSVNGMLIADSFLPKNGMELHSFRTKRPFLDPDDGKKTEGRVVLYKYNSATTTDFDDYELLDGAVFALYGPGGFIQNHTVAGGRIVVTDLPDGAYYFQEVTPPPGFKPSDQKLYFNITPGATAENTVYLYAPNDPYNTSLTIRKVDDNTGATLEGAVFELYQANGRMSPLKVGEGTTDASGLLTFPASSDAFQLVEGRYLLVEARPPADYERMMGSIEIYVDFDRFGNANILYRRLDENDIPMDSFSTLTGSTLDVENTKKTTQDNSLLVVITKTVEGRDDMPVVEAKFAVYSFPETGGKPDENTVWIPDSKNNYETDQFGHFYLDLDKGHYYKIVEVETPPGFSLVDGRVDTPNLKIEQNGEIVNGHMQWTFRLSKDFVLPARGRLVFPPDADVWAAPTGDTEEEAAASSAPESGDSGSPGDGDDHSSAGEEPPGGGTDPEHVILPHVAYFHVELPAPAQLPSLPDADIVDPGLSETEPPPLPVLPDNSDVVGAGAPPNPVLDEEGGAPAADSQTDPPHVVIILPGADPPSDNTATPDSDPGNQVVLPPALSPAADEGFTGIMPVNGPAVRSEVSESGISIHITNSPNGKIVVEKQDDQTFQTLAGATFALYYNLGTEGNPNDTSENADRWQRVATGTTGSDGTVTFPNLWPGEYRVMEIVAPPGYEEIVAPEPVLTDDRQSSVVIGGNLASFNFIARNPRTQGSIHIAKVDGDTLQALPGASFNLTYWDEKEYAWKPYEPYSYTSDQNGRIHISGLPYGRYKIIEMQPPDGYQVETAYDKNELIFTISNNGVYAGGEITVANYQSSDTDISLPRTGTRSGTRYYSRESDTDTTSSAPPHADVDAPEAAGPLPAPPESSGAFQTPTGNPGTGSRFPLMRAGSLLFTTTLFAAAIILDRRGNRRD